MPNQTTITGVSIPFAALIFLFYKVAFAALIAAIWVAATLGAIGSVIALKVGALGATLGGGVAVATMVEPEVMLLGISSLGLAASLSVAAAMYGLKQHRSRLLAG